MPCRYACQWNLILALWNKQTYKKIRTSMFALRNGTHLSPESKCLWGKDGGLWDHSPPCLTWVAFVSGSHSALPPGFEYSGFLGTSDSKMKQHKVFCMWLIREYCPHFMSLQLLLFTTWHKNREVKELLSYMFFCLVQTSQGTGRRS